jgi:hypothetical protein
VKGKELALYYIFQTGAGWAGPIGDAELVVNLPYPASEATLAVASPGSLRLPYGGANALPAIPAEVILQGNQARWTWKDFEPGAQDDFAAWLMDINEWQKLETAKARVQAQPEDGQAWLELAGIYRSLATGGWNSPSIFSQSYLQPGLGAYQKAAELLPEHPAPHAGLALLTLAPFMKDKNAPPQVMQTVQDELSIARELEAKNPALMEGTGISSLMVEDVLNIYAYNSATATAEAAPFVTPMASETAAPSATLTLPSATAPTSATPTALATEAPQPMDTAVPQLMPTPQGGLSTTWMGILLVGLLAVVGVVIVVLRRR